MKRSDPNLALSLTFAHQIFVLRKIHVGSFCAGHIGGGYPSGNSFVLIKIFRKLLCG